MDNVLLLCPNFYNYREIIKNELVKQGYNVHSFDERPSNATFFKITLRLLGGKFFSVITKRYYRNILESISHVKYINTILIINPEALGKDTLMLLKKEYPEAQVVLYLWDSLKNKKYISSLFEFCNRIYTFDYNDAKKFGFTFLPLFFSVKPQEIDKIEKKKIIFIGSVHSTRFDIISKIHNIAVSNNINFKFNLYFPSRLIFWFSFLRKKSLRNDLLDKVILKPLPYEFYLKEMQSAEFVLDVSHPKQSGLTMRTMEALAYNKKIITTNDNIRHYDFFDPNKHFILNDINEKNIIHFVNTSQKECSYSPSTINRYSISSWVRALLEQK
ncbi:hypothetical protein [Escherichia coli]|nr:hypothetical protein [Escherichia coli]MCH6435003.1 hypothetical protein [Escherichia coli]